MKRKLTLAFGCLAATGMAAQAQSFDTLAAWGNASGTTPAPAFTNTGGTVAIDAGGADLWGNADQGAFVYDSAGAYTTSGDYTATVRHLSTSNPAPTWGRDAIMARASQTPGTTAPLANDSHMMALRRSDSGILTGWRGTVGGGTGRDDANFPIVNAGGPVSDPTYAAFLALSRTGNVTNSAHAADITFGDTSMNMPGRWVPHASITGSATQVAASAGTEVVVGLGHQSHPQSGGGSGNGGVNTATYDNWNFSGAGTTWAAPAADYAVGGNYTIDTNNGTVSGAAYTFENGAATGEKTGWKIRAWNEVSVPAFNTPVNSTSPLLGTFADTVVPAANFRTAPGSPGLNADIYLAANGGNLGANQAIIAGNTPNGTTVVPDVWWSEPGGPPDGYPDATGGAGSNGGANTTNLFHQAVLVTDPASTAFTGNQDSYGVHLTGEIFIPDDAARGGEEFIAFKEGVDDFTYMVVDGNQLFNDNSWTGAQTTQNNGGAVALLDTSDPKYDDGEWVTIEMILWEGGGGDPMSLHWDLDSTDGIGIDPASYPENTIITDEYIATGTDQIGSDTTTGLFTGVDIPNGTWDNVEVMLANTGSMIVASETDVTIVPEPTAPALIGLGLLGAIMRRRRR